MSVKSSNNQEAEFWGMWPTPDGEPQYALIVRNFNSSQGAVGDGAFTLKQLQELFDTDTTALVELPEHRAEGDTYVAGNKVFDRRTDAFWQDYTPESRVQRAKELRASAAETLAHARLLEADAAEEGKAQAQYETSLVHNVHLLLSDPATTTAQVLRTLKDAGVVFPKVVA